MCGAEGALTVDMTSVPAPEAALRIVEFVRGLEAERDADMCCSSSSSAGGSAATTPRAGLDCANEWRVEEGKGR